MTNLHEEYWKVPREDRPRPKIEECVPRRLYRIACRNLKMGVYDGKEGFIGIREKFGHKYLFTEYHWDQGPPFGTVHTVIDTGIDLPEEIELKENVVDDEDKTFTTYQPLLDWLVKQGGDPSAE